MDKQVDEGQTYSRQTDRLIERLPNLLIIIALIFQYNSLLVDGRGCKGNKICHKIGGIHYVYGSSVYCEPIEEWGHFMHCMTFNDFFLTFYTLHLAFRMTQAILKEEAISKEESTQRKQGTRLKIMFRLETSSRIDMTYKCYN